MEFLCTIMAGFLQAEHIPTGPQWHQWPKMPAKSCAKSSSDSQCLGTILSFHLKVRDGATCLCGKDFGTPFLLHMKTSTARHPESVSASYTGNQEQCHMAPSLCVLQTAAVKMHVLMRQWAANVWLVSEPTNDRDPSLQRGVGFDSTRRQGLH